MELRATRTMTTAGDEQFQESVSRHTSQLSSIQREIDYFISQCKEGGVNLSDIDITCDEAKRLFEKYTRAAQTYEQFLRGHRTPESAAEEESFHKLSASVRQSVKLFIEHLKSSQPDVNSGTLLKHASRKSKSRKSNVTRTSQNSSKLTAALLEHTVKVEEARTRMKYAEEEAELIKQEAALKASRTMLTVKKELEAAEHGLDAVRMVLDFENSDKSSVSDNGDAIINTHDREENNFLTDRYVRENVNVTKPPTVPNIDSHSFTTDKKLDISAPVVPSCTLNPAAMPFQPQSKQSEAFELAKVVVKNQLIPQRLWKFRGEPSRYLTWKNSFQSVMNDISANTLEQLDLLINHMESACKVQCDNIRSTNARDPSKALREIWERLDMEYGSAEAIEQAIKQRIIDFPTLTENDHKRYFDLYDLAAEVESLKSDATFQSAFAYFDSSSGKNDLARKLPKRYRERWATKCDSYKVDRKVSYVPFLVFAEFLRDLARLKNDPSLMIENLPQTQTERFPVRRSRPQVVDVKKVAVAPDKTEQTSESNDGVVRCPIHGGNAAHVLKDCRKLLKRPYKERVDYLFKKGYCLKCCGQKRHLKKNCRETVKCDVCDSKDHVTILHPDFVPWKDHEGEQSSISAKCTEVCSVPQNTSKSCAKMVLINVFPEGEPHRKRKVYCVIDDQSNRSLASSSFFDAFGETGPETEYVLSTCAGRSVTSGRKASGYIAQSLDGSYTHRLPSLIECNEIPSNREEIPSKSVARYYSHLTDIGDYIPELDQGADIEILIGRDLISAHHVLDQRVGRDGLPFGQRLPFGWVIIGNVCLGKAHQPETVNVMKTSVLRDGRASLLVPCDSEFSVKEGHSAIFQRLPGDEKPGPSIEDKKFMSIMESGFNRSSDGFWEAPLPFRDSRQTLPDNRSMALSRAKSFDASLHSNPVKCKQVIDFMAKLLVNHHAELAPDLPFATERWYLPMFAIHHPKKPESVRVVFDSSAKYQDVSLNSVLLQGPDLLNNLLGILLRFRREKIAATMDVEHMFYNFKVPEEQRCYLRFIWHQNNDLDQPLADYQMTRHVFGNSTSPSVANYGFRKIVEGADKDVQNLINENFYVDDGLVSCKTVDQTVDLVLRAQRTLQDRGRIRLHKFASNSRQVLNSLDQADLAKDLKDLDLGTAALPTQRSLGLLWNTERDSFIFRVNQVERPYTRRGLLSTINSVYDPIGFVQPVIIEGKLLLREMISATAKTDWDDPLPADLYDKWVSWIDALTYLEELSIPRMYSDISFEDANHREVLVFADSSKDAIAASAYLKLYDVNRSTTSFLMGKAKVALSHGHSIPRLELCAAVLAVEIAETIADQLNIHKDNFSFFTDSQVVLGYISNECRRFYIYVGNRVSRIRLFSEPSQWHFVKSECNPADVATRGIQASKLSDSLWLRGPQDVLESVPESGYSLVEPDHDVEVRPAVNCQRQELEIEDIPKSKVPFSDLFSRFSSWNKLVRTIARIKFWARRHHKDGHSPDRFDDPELLRSSELAIIACVQKDIYAEELKCINDLHRIPHNSSLKSLSPIITDGVLRVGGRLNKAPDADVNEHLRNPIILPKNHHITLLVIRHYHQKVYHQGRHFTEGEVRSAGYWIVGMKGMISAEINRCVVCRKLRGKFSHQRMADLPEDRCKPGPPFSYVGVDTFGPWTIAFRRTRGGSANHKRWALLFTCLVTRAIHIEVIEQLSSSSFINALRRFVAIRGPVTQFRSDRGTNFIGASEDLSIDADFVEKGPVSDFLSNSHTVWKFNPPHAPHMGGVWERLIGTVKRILNSMLLQHHGKVLTHEELTTLMSEICAIVNNRPLVDVSCDPESPSILTPSMLLTMKSKLDSNPFPSFGTKDALKSAWKNVQVLADAFWKRWKSEYLHRLQERTKWQELSRNLKVGDLVLVKDAESPRNEWPTGLIQRTFESKDGLIRKVEVAIMKDDKRTLYVRPVTDLVTLLEVA